MRQIKRKKLTSLNQVVGNKNIPSLVSDEAKANDCREDCREDV